jgi:hypothetical protein
LEQSAYPPMHVICLHDGIVLFFASEPSSDWVNLSLLQGPLLYQWDALFQLCQVVSILKQCSVLAAQDIKTVVIWDILLCTVIHRNKESGEPCCFHPNFSQKDYHELPWRKGWHTHPKCWFPYINLHGIISQNLLTSLSFISFRRSSYVSYTGLTLWYTVHWMLLKLILCTCSLQFRLYQCIKFSIGEICNFFIILLHLWSKWQDHIILCRNQTWAHFWMA